jgi:hypothetical protein
MSHFTVEAPPLVIPDDLTVAQFTLDRHHPSRPLRPASAPWFIEDGTGRPVFFEEVRFISAHAPLHARLYCCDCPIRLNA